MFNSAGLSERSEDTWEDRWFDAPFLRAERCTELDNWSRGKHCSNKPPEKLSDSNLKTNAIKFLKDYEAMILAYCQAKWRRQALGADMSTADILGAKFKFQPSMWQLKLQKQVESKDKL